MHHVRNAVTSLALLVTAGASLAAGAASPSVPVRTDAIVGHWQVYVSLTPCANPAAPPIQFRAFNTFHAGGTLSDTNASAARGPGAGIWARVGADGYQSRFQFMRFVNGIFDGIQDIETTVVLAPGGDVYTAAVRARVLNVDDSLRVELCGTADGERVTL